MTNILKLGSTRKLFPPKVSYNKIMICLTLMKWKSNSFLTITLQLLLTHLDNEKSNVSLLQRLTLLTPVTPRVGAHKSFIISPKSNISLNLLATYNLIFTLRDRAT